MNIPDPAEPRRSPLLDQLRDRIRVKHYSIRTEQAYVDWESCPMGFESERGA